MFSLIFDYSAQEGLCSCDHPLQNILCMLTVFPGPTLFRLLRLSGNLLSNVCTTHTLPIVLSSIQIHLMSHDEVFSVFPFLSGVSFSKLLWFIFLKYSCIKKKSTHTLGTTYIKPSSHRPCPHST